jgi:glycosyltransferase involved in cell wall biosynthesis
MEAPNRRLKIVYVLDSAGTARAGGLVSGDRIIAGLREHHDVVSVGLNGDLQLPQLEMPVAKDLVQGNSFAFAKPDAQKMREAITGADVVHIQLPFFLGWRALKLAKELGVPVVTAHHVQPENLFASMGLKWPRLAHAVGTRRSVRWLNRLMVRLFHSKADLVICPSQLALDELRDVGLSTPAVIISNGAPEKFGPADYRPPHPFTVLSVGRFVPEKRHDVIIEAVRQAKHGAQMRLVIAGKGPLQNMLEGLAADHPADVRIGFVEDDELLKLYQTADVYVHASEVELEGMAAVEAMRCGCPSILADSPASATRQFALDRHHLFHPGDAAELAGRLDEFFEHRVWLEAERKRTLDSVKDLGLHTIIGEYEKAYLGVVKRREPAGAKAGRAA